MNSVWILEKCKGLFFRLRYLKKTIKGYFKANTNGFIPIIDISEKNKLKGIVISCRLTGGLGDYIIESKLIEELMQFPVERVDVYCENIIFGKAVFNENDILSIKYAPQYYFSLEKYDMAIMIEHYVHIHSYNAKRLLEICPELLEKIEFIKKNWEEWYVNIPEQCFREKVHFERCKILGMDRWTEMRMKGAFEIINKIIYIPLREEGLKRFKSYELKEKEYITLNYGADLMWKSGMQVKVWPLAYYNEFIKAFRNQYPNIRIVQIGNKNSARMEKADCYVMGEDLETVKWVLKNSRLHIDCEGGLVHMATQLQTKCAVLFGPTPEHMYAYEQNINIRSDKCSACMGVCDTWAFSCYRNMQKPACMYGIKPSDLLEKITDYMVAN